MICQLENTVNYKNLVLIFSPFFTNKFFTALSNGGCLLFIVHTCSFMLNIINMFMFFFYKHELDEFNVIRPIVG